MTLTAERTRTLTPGGHAAVFETRPGTSDSALVGGIIGEDEYGLRDLPPLTGWAIDIGAHIGTVAVALALDHPALSVIAVEALPENVQALDRNVALNGLEDRVMVRAAAASSESEAFVPITYGWTRAQNQPDGYMSDNRFIGGMVGPNETSTTINCPALSLGDIFAEHDIASVELLKIDCEGCEWYFLTSPEIVRCKRIWGELHWGKNGGAKEFRTLLEPTHDVEMDDTKNVALFRATRRTTPVGNDWPTTPRITNAWPQ